MHVLHICSTYNVLTTIKMVGDVPMKYTMNHASTATITVMEAVTIQCDTI